MAKYQTLASDVRVDFLELITPLQVFDLKPIFVSMNIYEDMFGDSLTVDILINDSINLPYHGPILGEEYLNFEISTKSIETEKGVSLLPGPMYTVSITNRHITKDRQQLYMLHFTSEQDIVNSNTTLSRSFRNKKISTIVTEILDTHLGSDNTQDIEETKGLENIVIPNWKPFKAINWLAKRAINNNDVANYLFWETIDYTHFISLDKILSRDIVQKFVLNTISSDSKKQDAAAAGFMELDSLGIVSQFNITRNIKNGYYSSKLITHDIIKKSIKQNNLSLTSLYTDEINHTDEYMPISTSEPYYSDMVDDRVNFAPQGLGINEGNNIQSFSDSKIIFYPKHDKLYSSVSSESYNNNVEQWLLQRNSLIQGLNQIKLIITFPGISYLRTGDKVSITVPSPERVIEQKAGKIKDPEKLNDKYLSGVYLITSLKHTIDYNSGSPKYSMTAELTKDALGDVPSYGGIKDES